MRASGSGLSLNKTCLQIKKWWLKGANPSSMWSNSNSPHCTTLWWTRWRDRASRALEHINTAAATAFTPDMLSEYESNWTIATAASMRESRLPESRRASAALSPFQLLPAHIRATGPHQGLDWWKILPDYEPYDFLAVAHNLKQEPISRECQLSFSSKWTWLQIVSKGEVQSEESLGK